VELLGMAPRQEAVADDGIFVDAGQPTGLTDAATLIDVRENRDQLRSRESAVEEGRAFGFGEALFASLTVQQAALLLTIVSADSEVIRAALAVVWAFGVLTAELSEIISRHQVLFR
jgi:hypothetical protein